MRIERVQAPQAPHLPPHPSAPCAYLVMRVERRFHGERTIAHTTLVRLFIGVYANVAKEIGWLTKFLAAEIALVPFDAFDLKVGRWGVAGLCGAWLT